MTVASLHKQEIINLTSEIVNHYKKHVHSYDDPPGDSSVKHVLDNHLIIRRQVDVFNIYKEYLRGSNKILDWGCKHGVDAYLASQFLSSEKLEIHGCDFSEEKHGILYKHCNLKYSELNHSYTLPYTNNYFDSIISSGVLEHVPNDYESLKEIYRILKNDGYLIITFLPNQSSYTESIDTLLKLNRGHKRKYSLNLTKKCLLHSGFVPLTWGFHQLMPSLASLNSSNDSRRLRMLLPIVEGVYSLNGLAEKLWPLNIFATNIFIIAQKKMSI
jgi:ubiquinone/menaquinone biosynthesis C-methylase UbiE